MNVSAQETHNILINNRIYDFILFILEEAVEINRTIDSL